MSELRYSVYTRKSSEEKNRQAPSLPSQKSSLQNIISGESLNIINSHSESCSAKVHGKRTAFYKMTSDIEKGTVNAIFSWSPNRISRNAVDTGLIVDLLDRGKLLEIKTPSQVFRNNPSDKFFFSLLCSQAKLENDNKGVDVKRGLMRKAEMGWLPGRARTGYRTGDEEKGYKTIQKDLKRFKMVQKMFHMVCDENYSPARILSIATQDWGLTRSNGQPLGYSTWYDMLHEPFFYGEFEYPVGSGSWHKGKHTPMITRKQHNKIQTILGRVDKAKPKTHEFLFTGLMKCGECGRTITAERKNKVLKSGKKKQYVYYHCSKRFKYQCSQGVIHEHVIYNAIVDKLRSIVLSEDLYRWLVSTVKAQIISGTDERNKLRRTYKVNLESCKKKLAALIDMRANKELTQDEFLERKQALTQKSESLVQKINNVETNTEQLLKSIETDQEFAAYGLERLQNTDDIKGIKRILRIICSNQKIIGKKPYIELKMPFSLFEFPVPGSTSENGVARTGKTRTNNRETGPPVDQFPVMLREPDAARNFKTAILDSANEIYDVAEEIKLYYSSQRWLPEKNHSHLGKSPSKSSSSS